MIRGVSDEVSSGPCVDLPPPTPSSHPDLAGRVALVTGGAGVLGGAFAAGLVANGVHVVILDRDGDKAAERACQLTESTGVECLGLPCDVLDRASLQLAATRVEDKWGSYHFLINAAGGNSADATTRDEVMPTGAEGFDGNFFDLDPAAFSRTLDLNLMGTVLPSAVLGRRMAARGAGAIVNISSMSAFRPLTRIPAYSAAKCAVSNFTQWLAVHVAATGLRVNAMAPGFFITEQLRYLAYTADGSLTPRYQRVLAHTPMGRFGLPEELSGTLLYLLSDQSRFVTGVVIPVDGGFNAFSGV